MSAQKNLNTIWTTLVICHSSLENVMMICKNIKNGNCEFKSVLVISL